MKKILFIITFLWAYSMSHSQVSTYVFSETTGTYAAITLGTQLVTTTAGATTYDTDGSYFALAAGNQFTFNGVVITSVTMTADGSLWLNPGTSTTGNGVTGPIASSLTATGIVSAMGMDLRSTSVAATVYERRWYDNGTEDIFQWQNCARYLQTTEKISFQIRITKSTGVIRIVYGPMTTTTSTTYQPYVGLRGSSNTDFNNRQLSTTVPDASPNWGAPNGTGAGSSNANTCRFLSTSSCFPSSGLTFIWTPGPIITPSVTTLSAFSTCSGIASSIQNFTVAGTNMSSGITITPPVGYEVSTSSTFASSIGTSSSALVIGASGTIASTTIYVRLQSTASTGTPSGNITLASTGATTKNIAVSGNVGVNLSAVVVSSSIAQSMCLGSNGTSVSVAETGGGTITSRQWGRRSTSGGSITNVTGTSSSYTPLGTDFPTTGTYYLICTSTPTCGSAMVSNEVTITITSNSVPLTYTQLFNAATIPSCWSTSIVAVQSASKISYVTSSTSLTASPQEGADFVKYNSFSNTNGGSGSEERLITPAVITTGTSSVDVEFYWYQNNGSLYNTGSYLNEGVTVEWSTNGTTWTSSTFYPRQVSSASATGEWSKKTITLPAGAGNIATLYVSFKFHSEYGYNMYLDNVVIKPTPSCSEPTLLVSSSITSTTSTISWTASSSSPSGGYDYYLSTSSTAPTGSSTPTGSVGSGVVTTNLSGLSSSTLYYYWVRSNCGSSTYSTWASSSFTTLLVNDNSAGAITLTINSSTTCTTTTTGTSVGATQTLAAQYLYGTADDDVWYKFTATAVSLNMTVARGTMGDLVVEGYTNALVSMGVVDATTGTESISFTNLTIGNVYYIRVYSYSSLSSTRGTFTICITTPTQPPSNDDASGAITLIVNNPYITGTNDGSTASTTAPTPTGPAYYGADIWYKVVVPTGGIIQIRTSSLVLTDVVMEVYSGSASALTYITYNDDSLSLVNAMPYIQLTGRTPGETIWIRIWDYLGNNTGTFSIRALIPVVLPISLVSFTGHNTVDGNSIEWKTASEVNSDYFTLERGLYRDGSVEWLELQFINGAGNSQEINTYGYFDLEYPDDINYYKLSQTDYDGYSVTYDMISIDNRINGKIISSMVNLLGQEVNENYRGIVVVTYTDGSVEKIMK